MIAKRNKGGEKNMRAKRLQGRKRGAKESTRKSEMKKVGSKGERDEESGEQRSVIGRKKSERENGRAKKCKR